MFEIGATVVDQDERDQAYQRAWAGCTRTRTPSTWLQQDLIYGMADNLVWEPRLDDEYYVSEMSLS